MENETKFSAKMEMNIVEAILYMENEPLDINNITKITNLSKNVVTDVIAAIKEEYDKDIHGLELLEIGGLYSFSPKKNLWSFLKSRYGKKNDKKLSRAAVETLAIIAYSQPMTRAEIESIRGVSSDGMVKLLLSQDLIREVGKKDAPGKPVQYGTTKEFLKIFHLRSISELPKLDEIDKKKFEEND